jgi:hypothetical protein
VTTVKTTPSGRKAARVWAGEIEPGDYVSHALTHVFYRVDKIERHALSSYMWLAGGGRIRPNHETRMWRYVDEADA